MRVRLHILKEYVSALLVEGRVDDAREAFPEMEEDIFDEVVANQPGGSNNKYLMWSLKQVETLMEADPDRQAINLVIQGVRLFNDNQQRLKQRDINQYADVAEIETAVSELASKKTKSQEQKQAKADTEVIYNDDRFLVVRPHTTEASCKYGTGTAWCIAATKSHNYFNSYATNNNKFYFVIDKRATGATPESKFAIAIIAPNQAPAGHGVQVYDAADKLVNISVLAKHVGDKWPEIWEKIQAHVKANPLTREVEDARKATEEHVKNLLKGDKVSLEGLKKIAENGQLTTPVVKAIIGKFDNYKSPGDFRDERNDIIRSFANRIAQMPPDAAFLALKWAASTRPESDASYWSGSYYVEAMMKAMNLAPENFRELASTTNESVLASIFENPNCPHDVKQQIVGKVEKFKVESEARKVYWALIKSGTITKEQFVTGLQKHSELVSQILQNPDDVNLPTDLINLIPIHDVGQLKRYLTLPNISPEHTGEVIDKIWKSLNKYDLYDILKSAKMSVDKIEQLWKDKGQDVRTALLQNPSIGASTAGKFAKSKNSAYRFAVAHNTETPSDDLDLLAKDESVSTRAAVGANLGTRAATLAKLAADEATVVRASVASNMGTPRNVLDALKRDSDDFVRKATRKTLKSLETTETLIHMMTGMRSLIREEIEDDSELSNVMSPSWQEAGGRLKLPEFIAVFLLQNNGSASREEVEQAYMQWDGRPRFRGSGRGRHMTTVKDLWSTMRQDEKRHDQPSRATQQTGRGWWWAPAGITKGSIYRLTPAGAATAMSLLERLRVGKNWGPARQMPPVKKSPPAATLDPNRSNEPRGPKTTYKVYGQFKGHPAATRLKGQAYVAPHNTRFTGGEQAFITPDDGKLKVKKTDSDHTQTWEPIDG